MSGKYLSEPYTRDARHDVTSVKKKLRDRKTHSRRNVFFFVIRPSSVSSRKTLRVYHNNIHVVGRMCRVRGAYTLDQTSRGTQRPAHFVSQPEYISKLMAIKLSMSK